MRKEGHVPIPNEESPGEVGEKKVLPVNYHARLAERKEWEYNNRDRTPDYKERKEMEAKETPEQTYERERLEKLYMKEDDQDYFKHMERRSSIDSALMDFSSDVDENLQQAFFDKPGGRTEEEIIEQITDALNHTELPKLFDRVPILFEREHDEIVTLLKKYNPAKGDANSPNSFGADFDFKEFIKDVKKIINKRSII